MVLSIIFLEDKHKILLHLSIWFCISYFLKTNIQFYDYLWYLQTLLGSSMTHTSGMFQYLNNIIKKKLVERAPLVTPVVLI
jgi:hypothetical protein